MHEISPQAGDRVLVAVNMFASLATGNADCPSHLPR